MYNDYITTQNEAICHLFLHCCYKDGRFTKEEIDSVADKFVALQINKDLNFKEELQHYRTYKDAIGDEDQFLKYVVKLINPVHSLALYSYCAELCLSDALLSAEEDALLKKLSLILGIGEAQATIDTLVTQRKAVEAEKIF